MTDTGFAEFVSSDVRDVVLKTIDADENKFKFNIEGKEIASDEHAPAARQSEMLLYEMRQRRCRSLLKWTTTSKSSGAAMVVSAA